MAEAHAECNRIHVSQVAGSAGHWVLVIGRAFRIIHESFVNNPG
jgi:hypothetical protein